MFRILILILIVSSSFITQAADKAQTIECPLKMPVNFKPVKMIPTFQFRDSETDEIEFVSLAIFDQDPKKNMQLKPDNGDGPQPYTWTIKAAESEKKDDGTPNWQQPTEANSGKSIIPWMACYYGKNSKQVFVKRFAKVPQSCTTKASKTNPKIFNTVVCN